MKIPSHWWARKEIIPSYLLSSMTPRKILIWLLRLKQSLQQPLPILILSHCRFLRYLKEIVILIWETKRFLFLCSTLQISAGISETLQHGEAVYSFWGMEVYAVEAYIVLTYHATLVKVEENDNLFIVLLISLSQY